MKKLIFKFCLISYCFIGLSVPSHAQEDYDWGMYLFIGWIESLNSKITQISNREKQERLIRKLGYLASDLDELWLSKENLHRLLIKEIQDNNNNSGSFLRANGYDDNDDFQKAFKKFENKLTDIEQRIDAIKDELTLSADEATISIEVIDYLKSYPRIKGESIAEMYMRVNFGEDDHQNDQDSFEADNYSRDELIELLSESMEKAVKLTKTARDSVLSLINKLENK